jgi:hypothetical protein
MKLKLREGEYLLSCSKKRLQAQQEEAEFLRELKQLQCEVWMEVRLGVVVVVAVAGVVIVVQVQNHFHNSPSI